MCDLVAENPCSDLDVCQEITGKYLQVAFEKTREISELRLASVTRTELQSATIQSAPACRNNSSRSVVCSAITRSPAAFPARIPAGASSNTTQSAGARPRSATPFRNGSG